jgi:hypothetical protein
MREHVDEPQQPRIPEEWRRQYLRRPIDRLPGDIIKAFDQLELRRRDADKMKSQLIETRRMLGIADVKVWVLMGAVTAEGFVIAWLVKIVLARMAH